MDASGFGSVEKQCIGALVDVTPIETYESHLLHLVGVTDAGIRVYFTCTPDFNMLNRTLPYDLKAVHVRLPPGFAANSGTQRPRQVHIGYSSRGVTIFASNSSAQFQDVSRLDDNDALWLMSSDLLAGSFMLSECSELQRAEGALKFRNFSNSEF